MHPRWRLAPVLSTGTQPVFKSLIPGTVPHGTDDNVIGKRHGSPNVCHGWCYEATVLSTDVLQCPGRGNGSKGGPHYGGIGAGTLGVVSKRLSDPEASANARGPLARCTSTEGTDEICRGGGEI